MPFLDLNLFADVERLYIVLDLYFTKASNNRFIWLGEVPEDVC